jgi:hypothetical protein
LPNDTSAAPDILKQATAERDPDGGDAEQDPDDEVLEGEPEPGEHQSDGRSG